MNTDWQQNELALPPRERRDLGMAQAVGKADRVSDGWSNAAFDYLRMYAESAERPFLIEQVRAASRDYVPEPPSPKAWGAVTMKAKRAGLISVTGYTTSTNSCAPKPLWYRPLRQVL